MKTSQGEKPSLEGRRALVVGGSGGIGRAVSLELGSRGAYVVVHGGSSREKLDSTLLELRLARELRLSRGPRFAKTDLGVAGAEGFLLDLGDPSSGLARLSYALPGLGDIDILVVAFRPLRSQEPRRHGSRRLGAYRPARSRPARNPLFEQYVV